MKKDPLVSIVLPTYNGSRYLAESVQSFLDQTYQNWELIIVDDASKDETPAIIDRYKRQDPRISSVRHEKNRGLPRGLNTGFARSWGEYLTWTSDDNLYEPEAIELMVRYLEGEPATGLVYCDVRLIGSEGEDRGLYLCDEPDALRRKSCIHACFLYRRAVYETVGDYDPKMVLAEDYDYWVRVAKRFPIAHLRDVIPYRYRHHPQSLTSTRRSEIKIQMLRVQCRHFIPRSEHGRVMTDAYWYELWFLRRRGNLKAAWYCARKLAMLAPWRWRYLKAALGTGLRYLLAGRQASNPPPESVLG
jgi:glycosyltransferase involved in cell wall biosynthesis